MRRQKEEVGWAALGGLRFLYLFSFCSSEEDALSDRKTLCWRRCSPRGLIGNLTASPSSSFFVLSLDIFFWEISFLLLLSLSVCSLTSSCSLVHCWNCEKQRLHLERERKGEPNGSNVLMVFGLTNYYYISKRVPTELKHEGFLRRSSTSEWSII